ncbi:ABC transporter permease [Zavarzinia sp. CC-PAN008]|uniref:ABC transporter permease n=1 Tax=Zavarzinia sp. CC-PAN008 TaxID=3243332 RepID=UPI003F7491F0
MAIVLTTGDAPRRAAAARVRLGTTGWTVTAVVVALFVALPVIVVAAAALAPSAGIWEHLASTVLGRYVGNSLALMLLVGAGTLVIGTGTAWLVTMCQVPGARVLEWALLLPMAVPAYVLAYTYTGLLDVAGPVQSAIRDMTGLSARDYWFPNVRSLGGAAVMLTLVLYPYVYLLARAAFLQQSVCVLEVGRTLGCSPWRAFLRIALPLARPALVAGVSLALMETLGDFGTVRYFEVDTFTTAIFRTWLGLGDPVGAAQLAAMLLFFVGLLAALERVERGGRRFHHTSTRYRPLPRFELSPLRRALALAACAAPILLGFVIPGVQLAAWAIEQGVPDARMLTYARHSVILATIAAVLAVGIALVLAYGVRIGGGVAQRTATRMAGLGYAVPGSVVAVGTLLPLSMLDHTIDGWARQFFGVSTGLVLSGTIIALLYAYLVRFLGVALNSVESGLAKVTPSMDAAARSLGTSPGRTLRRVHLPMIAPAALTAGLLVFVDVMKELPATTIVRPFNFDTLAVKAFEFASDERLREAGLPSLAIMACGILPVILLSRAIGRTRPGQHAGS